MKVSVKFDPVSVNKLRQGLRRFKTYSRDDLWNSMNRIAIYFVFSAEKETRIGRKNRRMMVAQNAEERRIMGGYKYGIKVFGVSEGKSLARRYGGKPKTSLLGNWWWTNDRATADELRKVRFRGAAKASWAGLKRKLGVAYNVASDMLKSVVIRASWVKFQKGVADQRIILINKLSYLTKIHPNIEASAMGKARSRFEAVERKKIENGLRVAWDRAA